MSEVERRKRSFAAGYLMSLAGTPIPIAPVQKEPVAYLYNGVRLPKSPEVPWEGYPHEVIAGPYTMEGYEGVYYFFGGSNTVTPTGFPTNHEGFLYDDCVFAGCRLATTEELSNAVKEELVLNCGANTWGSVQLASTMGDFEIDNILWTNIDILNEDGSVFLAASEPVPVYK